MKKYILLLLLVSFIIGSTSACFAQDREQSVFLDVGIGYGNEIEAPGIKVGAVYQINEQFRGAADGLYYLPGEDSNGVEFNWLEFNLNGHYLFASQENANFYLLSGLNFTKLSSDSDNIRLPSGDSLDKIYVGLNIGAGADFSLGSVKAFLEGKYALSSAHQLVMSAGLRIPL
jgi:hypothetical protein